MHILAIVYDELAYFTRFYLVYLIEFLQLIETQFDQTNAFFLFKEAARKQMQVVLLFDLNSYHPKRMQTAQRIPK